MKLAPTLVVVALIGIPGCSAPGTPPPATDAGAAVVRKQSAASVAPPPSPPAASPGQAVTVPSDAQYVCVTDASAGRTVTTIEFAPKVAALCRRHPEMGPCQYERNLCRRGGGRVYAAGGVEITMATEAEYDRKVMRVRFKSD